MQRSFTKKLKFCNSLTYSERLLKCGLCSLERRRLIADLVLLYKISNNLVEINLGDAITPLISRTRGHSKRFKIPPARINCKLHFFTNRTIKVWNSLSEITVNAGSVFCFRKCVFLENLNKFLVNGF